MNEKNIQNLKWTGSDRFVRVDRGLYVRVRKANNTYIIRKSSRGKNVVITLGHTSELSFREAKLAAAKYALENSVSGATVHKLIEQYKEDVVEPSSKVANQVNGYLNHIDVEFGKQKVMDVETYELVKFIKYYSSERGARSADRVRSYLIQLFAYGVELGYLKNGNPAEGITKRVTGYVAIDRKRVISSDEVKMIWSWKNPEQGWQKTEDNTRVIKFLLLTGLRISEAQTGYIDGDKFRIDDTKGKHPRHEKRPHWVYLTKTARDLLSLPRCTSTNIQAWLKRRLEAENYADKDRFTPHDARRTFATIANENGVEPFIVERCLNHKMHGMMSVYNHAEYEQERIECAKIVEKAVLRILDKM